MCERRRVLVVEDTAALRALLRAALEEEGYAVWTARHGGEALAALDAAHPCAILLDVQMPVVDGPAFARAYRDRPDADAHVLAMTAAAAEEALAAIAPAHVLRKPFDLQEALAVVDRWVRAHGAAGRDPAPPGGPRVPRAG